MLNFIKYLCNCIILPLQLIFLIVIVYVIFPLINMKINKPASITLCCIFQLLFTFITVVIYYRTIRIVNILNPDNITYDRV